MIVLVNGVPETSALWGRLQALLDEPSTALDLPGFGCARPDGFDATKDSYLEWLVGRLEAFDAPVDLVGHDWGAALVMRLAVVRPDLVTTWIADVAYILHPEYVWHDLAQIWSTPGEGESFWENYLAGAAADVAAVYEAWGVPADAAHDLASMADSTMAGCVVDLYRSSLPNPHVDWPLPVRPLEVRGLVLDATADSFGSSAQTLDVASRLGAELTIMEGVGHWWPLEDPQQAVRAMHAFWSR